MSSSRLQPNAIKTENCICYTALLLDDRPSFHLTRFQLPVFLFLLCPSSVTLESTYSDLGTSTRDQVSVSRRFAAFSKSVVSTGRPACMFNDCFQSYRFLIRGSIAAVSSWMDWQSTVNDASNLFSTQQLVLFSDSDVTTTFPTSYWFCIGRVHQSGSTSDWRRQRITSLFENWFDDIICVLQPLPTVRSELPSLNWW